MVQRRSRVPGRRGRSHEGRRPGPTRPDDGQGRRMETAGRRGTGALGGTGEQSCSSGGTAEVMQGFSLETGGMAFGCGPVVRANLHPEPVWHTGAQLCTPRLQAPDSGLYFTASFVPLAMPLAAVFAPCPTARPPSWAAWPTALPPSLAECPTVLPPF